MTSTKDSLHNEEWNKSQNKLYLNICYLQEIILKRKTYRLKLKGFRNIYYANIKQKIAAVVILILGRADFRERS